MQATFDGCQQSDTQGVLHNFVDTSGTQHSFQASAAIRDFCDDDIASPSKVGKRFKLTSILVDSQQCVDCCDEYGECTEWEKSQRPEVQAATPLR
jgi:hypothetical protein